MTRLCLITLILGILSACRDDSVLPDMRAKELFNTTWKLWSNDTIIWNGLSIGYIARKIESDSCQRTLSFFENSKCLIVDSCSGQSAKAQSGFWIWYQGNELTTSFDDADIETMHWRFLNYSSDTLQFVIQPEIDTVNHVWEIKTFIQK